MRRPHIRFSTQTLLLTTAILAADCAILRSLHASDVHQQKVWLFPRASAGQVAGFLPVLHFALLGLACVVPQRLRSAVRRGAEHTPQGPSAGTYFCVHFLALGCILARVAPDAIEAYTYRVATIVEPVLSRAEPYLGHFLDRIDDDSACFVLDSAVEGLLISGPLLILAMIGNAVANRAAKALPRYRFTVLSGLVSLGFALTGLSVCLTPRPIDEDPAVEFDFHVVDSENDRPIGSAFVRLIDAGASGPPAGPSGLTDRAGDLRLTGRFPATGVRNAFATLGSCWLWGHWVEVSATNYRTVRVPLMDVMGEVVDLASPHVGKVALLRGEAPAEAFRDIAGRYTTSLGFGGCTFEITADGRFGWVADGCTGRYAREFGYVRWENGALEFLPIPRPGHEVSSAITVRHRMVKWDGRRYLCFAEYQNLREFCRSSLRLDRSRPFGYVSGAYRAVEAVDERRPLRGFPELTGAVWLSFFRSELDLHNQQGGLRRALDALRVYP